MRIHPFSYLIGALGLICIVGPLFLPTEETHYVDVSPQERLSLEEAGIVERGSRVSVDQVRELVSAHRVEGGNAEKEDHYSFSVSCRLQDGSPLPGVEVGMRCGFGDSHRSVSDEKGIARISGLKAGRYSIDAKHDGYSPMKSSFHRLGFVVV
jgi:hypothetical protein